MNCISIIVNVEDEEREVCLSHTPGNESFVKDFDYGRRRAPSVVEVKRSLGYPHRIKPPTVVLLDEMDI